MASFGLVPGAGGQGWYWHRVAELVRAAGHRVVAADLPAGDDSAGLNEYTDVVVTAIEDADLAADAELVVVVGQSMGGLIAPLVCDRFRSHRRQLFLLNAMIPLPGESGGEWWSATGQAAARVELANSQGRPTQFDPLVDFFHDVPPEVVSEAMARGEPAQSDRPFADPWPLAAWPQVPTRVLAGRDDRFFPLEFQQRLAKDRLGLEVEQIPGGHLAALSHPVELAARLLSHLEPGQAVTGSFPV